MTITDRQALALFQSYLERRNCAPHTIRNYLHDLHGFFARGYLDILVITPAEVERYIESMQAQGLSPTTINRRLCALRRLYVYLPSVLHLGGGFYTATKRHFQKRAGSVTSVTS